MKPLSNINYTLNNKKKFIAGIISVMVAVGFLYILNTFVASIGQSMYRVSISGYAYHARMLPGDLDHPIPAEILAQVKGDKNVERVIPFKSYGLRYGIPGSLTQVEVIALRAEDMNYFLEKQKIKLIEGRLPAPGKKEIAIASEVGKNKSVGLGDKVGNSVNKFDDIDGEYEIVGVLQGASIFSVVSSNPETMPVSADLTSLEEQGALVFPGPGQLDELNQMLSTLSRGQVNVQTLPVAQDEYGKAMGTLKVLDIISILAILLMVVTVGSSKYIQFLNRKEELGILNAIGYSKREILKRATVEVLAVNFIAYGLGLLQGFLVSLLVKQYLFQAIGAIGVSFDPKALVISTFIPLFITLFTIVPINVMINRLDPINMIENN